MKLYDVLDVLRDSFLKIAGFAISDSSMIFSVMPKEFDALQR
jgi:hypothetical protein